jgi:hypothetical protein
VRVEVPAAKDAAHAVELAGTRLCAWRWFGLRGAGFPVDGLNRVADPGLGQAADALPAAAAAGMVPAWFEESFAESRRLLVGRIREILAEDGFRAAVAAQNLAALHRLDDHMNGGPGSTGTRKRRAERTIVSYWQRYCAKNDTIGWFGPFGWGRFGERTSMDAGPEPAAERRWYFESWALDVFAEWLAAEPELRPWAIARAQASCHLAGEMLYRPFAPPLHLEERDRQLLALCDGTRACREVALDARRDRRTGIWTEAEGLRALEDLRRRGLITIGFELPLSLRPERELRAWLERKGAPAQLERALAGLDRLGQGRLQVAAATDSGQLEAALSGLDGTFSELTGAAPTRHAGQTYGSRTLLFPDCRRDVEISIGPRLLAEIAAPLQLVVTSARWLTTQLASWFEREFAAAYERARRQTGEERVGLARTDFLRLLTPAAAPVELLARQHADRWADLLLTGQQQDHHVVHRADELRDAVRSAFAPAGRAWTLARYHSPDLLVAAESAEVLDAGRFEVVLGELHPAHNTLLIANEVDLHADPDEIRRAFEADFTEPLVVMTLPKDFPQVSGRLRPALDSERDFHVSFGADAGGAPAGRRLPIAAMTVCPGPHGLRVVSRDGSLSFRPADFFGQGLSSLIAHAYLMHPPLGHVPRVSIGRLTVIRESWCLRAAELSFFRAHDDCRIFAAARLWAAKLALPRLLFARIPDEPKPVLLDLDSPHSVITCARLVAALGGDAMVSFQEMLPTPAQAWLRDGLGRRYTSELRVVLVEREP